uniref:Uncharacterized protein n=1 Tax=Knipowitschia caucasica TaxID=637954 RepID=A0AAV2MQ76_KNICA
MRVPRLRFEPCPAEVSGCGICRGGVWRLAALQRDYVRDGCMGSQGDQQLEGGGRIKRRIKPVYVTLRAASVCNICAGALRGSGGHCDRGAGPQDWG